MSASVWEKRDESSGGSDKRENKRKIQHVLVGMSDRPIVKWQLKLGVVLLPLLIGSICYV